MSPKWSSAHMTALFMHMSNLGYAVTSRDDNLDKWVPGISVDGRKGREGGGSQVQAGSPEKAWALAGIARVDFLMIPPNLSPLMLNPSVTHSQCCSEFSFIRVEKSVDLDSTFCTGQHQGQGKRSLKV